MEVPHQCANSFSKLFARQSKHSLAQIAAPQLQRRSVPRRNRPLPQRICHRETAEPQSSNPIRKVLNDRSPGTNSDVCTNSHLLNHASPYADPTARADMNTTRQASTWADMRGGKVNIVIHTAACVGDDAIIDEALARTTDCETTIP